MQMGSVCIAVVVRGTCTFNSTGVAMDTVEHDRFKVYYTDGSGEIAQRLLAIAAKIHRRSTGQWQIGPPSPSEPGKGGEQ